MTAAEHETLCPSAQPGMDELRVLGVVTATPDGPRVAYVREDIVASDEVLAMAEPVQPTEVFRLSGRCAGGTCAHFQDHRCRLAERVVGMLLPVVSALPPCRIRPSCRWYVQEGREACLRCPQIATMDVADQDRAALATPD